MERFNPDRSHELALQLEQVAAPAEPQIWTLLPAPDSGATGESQPAPANGHSASQPQTLPETCQSPRSEADALLTVRRAFDTHLRRLARLQASLRQAPTPPEAPETGHCAPITLSPQSRHKPHAQPPLLQETVVYLNRLEHPPLLPAPRTVSFMDAFKRHEPMFHTVFYRKYPPWVLDDAKQEALLALYRKWLKNKSILEQSSAYVVQAGIYGVSNWRQKGMRVCGNEGALLVDGHGKVIGEPHSHSHERWTDGIDLRLDVARAVRVVLDQHKACPDYGEIYRALEDVRHEVPFKQGQQASGLSFRAYKQQREQIKADLRLQLAEYAPQCSEDVRR